MSFACSSYKRIQVSTHAGDALVNKSSECELTSISFCSSSRFFCSASSAMRCADAPPSCQHTPPHLARPPSRRTFFSDSIHFFSTSGFRLAVAPSGHQLAPIPLVPPSTRSRTHHARAPISIFIVGLVGRGSASLEKLNAGCS